MKIALDNELPGLNEYKQLLSSMEDNSMDAGQQYEQYCNSRYVLAAYDQGRLVGIGRVADENEVNQTCHITMLQNYRVRDVDTYMRKLLFANRIG
ncbi:MULTISPECIES: hypothetical protein [Paenibacillus]|uniref:N-acetyltransferase domain-containing protein n=1 Tax=Paenibacillus radicis (ex Xue et al. 2023) TaxID=2972489 RepID=A0ABT1YUG9_9BACL|nr:hypothetical protein [Paenibacillus radicis (ex Xue et al. 2023)]MCR8636545.1 hypothetical protein [Paenibacillus radicis (ex Xue et al. 2023)]